MLFTVLPQYLNIKSDMAFLLQTLNLSCNLIIILLKIALWRCAVYPETKLSSPAVDMILVTLESTAGRYFQHSWISFREIRWWKVPRKCQKAQNTIDAFYLSFVHEPSSFDFILYVILIWKYLCQIYVGIFYLFRFTT